MLAQNIPDWSPPPISSSAEENTRQGTEAEASERSQSEQDQPCADVALLEQPLYDQERKEIPSDVDVEVDFGRPENLSNKKESDSSGKTQKKSVRKQQETNLRADNTTDMCRRRKGKGSDPLMDDVDANVKTSFEAACESIRTLTASMSDQEKSAIIKTVADSMGSVEKHQLFNALAGKAGEPFDSSEKIFKEIAANYRPYPEGKKMTVESITAHLKAQLGPYLKAFGAVEDRIYLNQLRKIEPATNRMDGILRYAHNKDKSVSRLSKIFPTVSEKVAKRRMKYTAAELKEVERIVAAERMKKSRKKRNFSVA